MEKSIIAINIGEVSLIIKPLQLYVIIQQIHLNFAASGGLLLVSQQSLKV